MKKKKKKKKNTCWPDLVCFARSKRITHVAHTAEPSQLKQGLSGGAIHLSDVQLIRTWPANRAVELPPRLPRKFVSVGSLACGNKLLSNSEVKYRKRVSRSLKTFPNVAVRAKCRKYNYHFGSACNIIKLTLDAVAITDGWNFRNKTLDGCADVLFVNFLLPA